MNMYPQYAKGKSEYSLQSRLFGHRLKQSQTVYEYLIEFYSWNAIELEFTHVPYRDPDKAIPLYDTRGKKKEYAYIDLK